jgi:ABC-2 type transport system permease protein
MSSLVNLLALISAPASFGLLAYPVTYLTAGILNGFHFEKVEGVYFLFIVMFWLAASVITYFIAEISLLSRNAMVYETLFVTPVMILSGLFQLNISGNQVLQGVQALIPISFPVQLLTGEISLSLLRFVIWLLVLLVWLLIAYAIFRSLLYKIRIQGKVEVM